MRNRPLPLATARAFPCRCSSGGLMKSASFDVGGPGRIVTTNQSFCSYRHQEQPEQDEDRKGLPPRPQSAKEYGPKGGCGGGPSSSQTHGPRPRRAMFPGRNQACAVRRGAIRIARRRHRCAPPGSRDRRSPVATASIRCCRCLCSGLNIRGPSVTNSVRMPQDIFGDRLECGKATLRRWHSRRSSCLSNNG